MDLNIYLSHLETWLTVLILASGLGGFLLTGLFVKIISWRVTVSIEKKTGQKVYDRWKDPNSPHWFVGPFAGVIERTFFVLAIGFGLPGAVPAMVGWIGIKGVVHWSVFDNQNKHHRVAFSFIGVLGTMFSLIIATLCGVYLLNAS